MVLYVHVEDRDDLTGEQARQLAAALIEAADELERITSRPTASPIRPAIQRDEGRGELMRLALERVFDLLASVLQA